MKKYITVMFPYPSGASLHIGHYYNYAIIDSYCKMQKFQGHEVFQPFGFDSFGLPTENYAKKIGRDPYEVADENIANFNKQMERMNTGYVEMLRTHSPEYIKQTQRIFTLLKDHGLAYKAERPQPYCPSCDTVLSKEQSRGYRCERCGTETIDKKINQWFFKITDYTQRLIDDLDKVDYPESTKAQQRHWMENHTDWSVGRQRSFGAPIPIEGETDTLDTFVDSSFYTIEYDPTRPVDLYVGGAEHACGHLIFARFICKFLFDIGEINFDEPFKKVVHQGMILGSDGQKMSKTLGNTINPDDYDPQLLRMYLMFINHYFEGGKWKDDGYKGCVKFKNRFDRWLSQATEDGEEIDTQDFEAKIIAYFEAFKTNKVVSTWMEFYNANKNKTISTDTAETLESFFNTCF